MTQTFRELTYTMRPQYPTAAAPGSRFETGAPCAVICSGLHLG
jgi:hypothetical protein